MNYEYYTYRIDFADGFYYYGLKKLHKRLSPEQDGYYGSPYTNKSHWENNICCKTVLFLHEDRKEAAITEEQLIGDRWKSDPLCLNAAGGGKSWVNGNKGRKLSKEQIEGMRQRGRLFRHSEESKKKMSDAQRGRVPSEESKRKNRESNLGKTHSIQSRKKMSASQLGKRHTLETRQKMSKSKIKSNTCSNGFPVPVLVKNLNTNEVARYESMTQVAKVLGISGTTIINKSIERQTPYRGFMFSRLEPKKTFARSVPISVLNISTGEKHIFESMSLAARSLPFKTNTSLDAIRRSLSSGIPYKGYAFERVNRKGGEA